MTDGPPLYGGSCLTREEWDQAITDVVEHHNMLPVKYGVSIQPDVLLDRLVEYARVDRPYAWWAAHMYARLNKFTAADMPERLKVRINQEKKANEISSSRKNH